MMEVFVMLAYLQLKRWKGEEEAVRWIRSGPLADAMHESLSLTAYEHPAYDLLWELLPEPLPSGQLADKLWLLRAASLPLDPTIATRQRRNAVSAHFRAAGDGRKD